MKLGVVGSRGFNSYSLLSKTLDSYTIDEIVSGHAAGADSLAERYAKERGIPTTIYIPEWEKYGKSAGYKRNVLIVEASDMVIAFWDGESKGTQHTMNICKSHNVPCEVVLYKDIE